MSSLKSLFVLTTLVAAISYYFLVYGCDSIAAFVSVIFVGLLTSATLAKLIRVKIDLARRRYLRKKFFRLNKLKK